MTSAAATLEIPADDIVLPFQIDPFALRGRVVRLGAVADTIIGRHDYPLPVAQLLAEAMALTAALAAALSYEGVFTLQAKGNGPVRLLVVDLTSEGDMRGYAQFDAGRLPAAKSTEPAASVPRLLGAGYLAFTVDQGPETDRYQGIVELEGASLADCAHHYFRQSEQVETAIKLAADRVARGGRPAWRAGALMIQRLAPEGAQGSDEGREEPRPLAQVHEEVEEGWRRAIVLMGSAKAAELVDPELPAWRLADRLFLAEGIRIYRPHALRHRCRCSEGRVERMLRSLPRDEIETFMIDGVVVITCEFCNARQEFDAGALDRVYAAG